MRVYLRNRQTRQFLTESGQWGGSDVQKACDFHDCLHALQAAHAQSADAIEIYYGFGDDKYDFAVAVGGTFQLHR